MKEVSAGAVLYTRQHGKLYFLLVMEHKGHIGFPKGHLETGETEEQAALREIWEESGIRATLRTGFRHVMSYPVRGNPKDTIYFVSYFQDQIPQLRASEVAGVMLVSYEKALKLLTYQNSRELLRNAVQWIEENPE